MKHIMKQMQLPSGGRRSGLPMVIDDDWSIEQVVAVAELLEDLLHVIRSRYQGKLYAYLKATRITEFEIDGPNDNE
ncbi:MAG TPA: hypothetical protein PLB25_20810, partial [Rhodoferax sp.]|nr:hypothetical protein [Rhodoferax sp.]